MATFGPPFVNTANIADGAITSAKIALDTIAAVDVAPNAIGDSEVVAHTTTKITVPTSLITGTLPLNQGGTGAVAKEAAFDALSPVTTEGDLIFRNATVNTRLPKGTALQALRMNAGATAPEWSTPTSTTFVSTNVFTGASPTTSTALDISAVVGAAQKMVLLKVTCSLAREFLFQDGGTTATLTVAESGANHAKVAANSTFVYVIVRTNTSGVLNWDSDDNTGTTTIDVHAYW